MPEIEKSLRTIFVEAVEMTDEEERAAYLERVCGDDAALRQRLEKLLKSHADAERGAGEAGATNVLPPLSEMPGDRIGRYVLREQIGEGGCGVVYVAEQEEPIRRRVALKVIKLGMDTRSVIARFEAERQALAMMDHANIARVLDAGATDTGRPYFVMELVRGIRITDYCDQNNLSTQQRLDLFNQVCRAIQHAHQKGIIHRDIKPSNVLVTLHDGVPVPKVIDFGIAKATEGRLTDLTVYTELHQFIGTPAYMSPEQAEMSGLDVDTRSDIYSLGVLLYELLTGKTPFDARELLQAGLDQMRRIIREQEPVKPSTRLSTLTHADLSEVARHRHVEAPKLIHAVRGDLDWIIMKALEKDRTRRYETANALAGDIERHLNHEPVVARPPGNLYRFRKLVRRNKLAVAAASAVLAALVVGLGLATWLFFRERAALKTADRNASQAEKQAQRAEAEAARSRQVARFMQSMLNGVGPAVALGRDTKMLREILDQTAERVSKDLKDQPEVEAEMRSTIGGVYDALGVYDKAASMHREALAIRRKLFGDEHPAVAASLDDLACVIGDQGQLTESETMHREALAMRRKLLGEDHAAVAASLNDLALTLNKLGKLPEAVTIHREALTTQRKLFGDEHPDVANSLHNLGSVLQEQNQLTEAETMHREALRIHRKLLGGEHPDVAAGLGNLANVLHLQGQLAESEEHRREALAMWKKLVGDEHPSVATALYNLAILLRTQGKLDEAETMHREALAMKRKLFGGEHPSIADGLDELGNVLVVQRRLDEAEAMHREALDMRRKLLGEDHADVADSLIHLAIVLRRQGKLPESETMQREALARLRKLRGNEHPNVAVSLNNLVNVLRGQGKLDEAETSGREALAITRKCFGNEHPEVSHSLNNLAVVLRSQEKLEESEAMHREALTIRRKLLGNDHPHTAVSLENLADALYAQGKLTEMETLFREALARARASETTSPANLESRISDLAEILYVQRKYAEAEPLSRELLQSRNSRLPPGDENTLRAAANLACLLADRAWAEHFSNSDIPADKSETVGRAREAERLLRAAMAASAGQPATRDIAETRSWLGGAMVTVAVADPELDRTARLDKFTEAEPLLLEGHQGLQENQSANDRQQRDALTRLVRLYEAWDELAPNTGRAARAADWKRRLAAFDTPPAERKAAELPKESAE
jgi:eukaryotic-like serine/threonine-protein kinase